MSLIRVKLGMVAVVATCGEENSPWRWPAFDLIYNTPMERGDLF